MSKLLPQIITTLSFLITLELILQSRATTVTLTPSTVYVGAGSQNILSITDYKTGSDQTELVAISIKFSLEQKTSGSVTVTAGTSSQSVLVFILASYQQVSFTFALSALSDTITINGIKNPAYALSYTTTIILDSTQTFTSTMTYQPYRIGSNMNITLADDAVTNTLTTMTLNIVPYFALPADIVVKVTFPAYSAQDSSLAFLTNPVSFKGQKSMTIEMTSTTELLISNYLTADQTSATFFQIQIDNFLAPISTTKISLVAKIQILSSKYSTLIQEQNCNFSVATPRQPTAFTIATSSFVTLRTMQLTIAFEGTVAIYDSYYVRIDLPASFQIQWFTETLGIHAGDGRRLSWVINGNSVSAQQVGNSTLQSKSASLSLAGIRNYMGAYSSSLTFGITLFVSDQLQDILYAGTKTISYETYVNVITLSQLAFSPTTVQAVSTYSLSLSLPDGLGGAASTSTRISITPPSAISFSTAMLQNIASAMQQQCSTYVTSPDAASWASACMLETSTLLHVYGTFALEQAASFTLSLNSIVNPLSVAKTGPWVVQIFVQDTADATNWLKVYSNDLTDTNWQITPTSGLITVSQFVSTGSMTTSSLGTYTISITLTTPLLANSIIEIVFPSAGFDFSTMALSSCTTSFSEGLTSAATAAFSADNKITISTGSLAITANQKITLQVKNLRNPRSLAPTGGISVHTYPQSKSGVIDQTQAASAAIITMTAASTLTITSVQPASFLVGASTSYTVIFSSPAVIMSGDTLSINFSELTLLSSTPTCSGLSSLPSTVTCSADTTLNVLTIQIPQQIDALTSISFKVSSIRNPFSLSISVPLAFSLKDAAGFLVASATFSDVAKSSSTGLSGYSATPMISLSISPESLLVAKVTTYTVSLGTPIPITGSESLIVSLSSEIQVDIDSLSCWVSVRSQMASRKAICSYSTVSKQIIIADYLSASLRVLRDVPSYKDSKESPRNLKNNNNIRGNQDENLHLLSHPRLLTSSIDVGSILDVKLTGIKNKDSNGAYSSTAASLINVSLGNYNSNSNTYSIVASSDYQLTSAFTCSSPCSSCSGADTLCTVCISSYYFLPESNSCAVKCPDMYAKLSSSSSLNAAICKRCQIQDTDTHCTACSPGNLSSCSSCQNHYTVSYASGVGFCELISSENDPMRAFVYDLQYNLPYICIYLFIMTVIILIRRIWMVPTLKLIAVLFVAYSLIEFLLLIVFTIKVILLFNFPSIIIACLLLISFVIIQIVFARKFSKSLNTDSNYLLYSPSYQTIRVIKNASLLNNFKTFLLLRSRFSIIKDIYNIPFSNAHQHAFIMKRGCQCALVLSLSVFIFNFWIMIYSYNLRLITIPPFFFIEYGIFQVFLIILLCVLLISKPHGIASLFNITDDIGSKYKLSHLDIKVKSQQASFFGQLPMNLAATNSFSGQTLHISQNVKNPLMGQQQYPISSASGLFHPSNGILMGQQQQQSSSEISTISKPPSETSKPENNNNINDNSPYNQIYEKSLLSQTPPPHSISMTPTPNLSNSLICDVSVGLAGSSQDLKLNPRFTPQGGEGIKSNDNSLDSSEIIKDSQFKFNNKSPQSLTLSPHSMAACQAKLFKPRNANLKNQKNQNIPDYSPSSSLDQSNSVSPHSQTYLKPRDDTQRDGNPDQIASYLKSKATNQNSNKPRQQQTRNLTPSIPMVEISNSKSLSISQKESQKYTESSDEGQQNPWGGAQQQSNQRINLTNMQQPSRVFSTKESYPSPKIIRGGVSPQNSDTPQIGGAFNQGLGENTSQTLPNGTYQYPPQGYSFSKQAEKQFESAGSKTNNRENRQKGLVISQVQQQQQQASFSFQNQRVASNIPSQSVSKFDGYQSNNDTVNTDHSNNFNMAKTIATTATNRQQIK